MSRLGLALMLGVLATGCASSVTGQTTGQTAGQTAGQATGIGETTHTMDLIAAGWEPGSIEVNRGDTVSFTNQLGCAATVTWNHFLFDTSANGEFVIPAEETSKFSISPEATTGEVVYSPCDGSDPIKGTITVGTGDPE